MDEQNAPKQSRAERRTREAVAIKARGLNTTDLLAWIADPARVDEDLDPDTLSACAGEIADKAKHPDE